MRLWTFAAALTLIAWLSRTDAADLLSPSSSIRVEVRTYFVSPAKAVELMPQLTKDEDITGIRAEMDRLVGTMEVELLNLETVLAHVGAEAISESLEEFRYPVEYNPPLGPSAFSDGSVRRFDPPYQKEPQWGPMVPTAMDVGRLGSSFKLIPTLEEDRSTINLSVTLTMRRFAGFRQFIGAKSPLQITGEAKQPEFEKQELKTSLTMRSGGMRLLGSFVDHRQRVILVTLQATFISPRP